MNKVRGYRSMLGFTQNDMADLLGISKHSYYLKESGKVSFSDKEKLIIKDIFKKISRDITIDDLFFTWTG